MYHFAHILDLRNPSRASESSSARVPEIVPVKDFGGFDRVGRHYRPWLVVRSHPAPCDRLTTRAPQCDTATPASYEDDDVATGQAFWRSTVFICCSFWYQASLTKKNAIFITTTTPHHPNLPTKVKQEEKPSKKNWTLWELNPRPFTDIVWKCEATLELLDRCGEH